MAFHCTVCGNSEWDRRLIRGDGEAVVFCKACGMGVLEHTPASTERFYADGYYGGAKAQDAAPGTHYLAYDLTAEHTLLWARLMVEAMRPRGGRILDVGCANGFLLRRLEGRFQRFGIEVNAVAAAEAAANGVTIISSDVADPRVAGYEQFHIVTALAVLEHVLDIRAAVAVCLDLLTPSGFLLYEVPLMSDTADDKDWVNGSTSTSTIPPLEGSKPCSIAFLVFSMPASKPISRDSARAISDLRHAIRTLSAAPSI